MTDCRLDSPARRPEINPRSHRQALLGALRERCAAQDRSFSAVALQAGLSPAQIAAVEAGEADVRLEEMTAICAILGVRTSELIARAEALDQDAR